MKSLVTLSLVWIDMATRTVYAGMTAQASLDRRLLHKNHNKSSDRPQHHSNHHKAFHQRQHHNNHHKSFNQRQHHNQDPYSKIPNVRKSLKTGSIPSTESSSHQSICQPKLFKRQFQNPAPRPGWSTRVRCARAAFREKLIYAPISHRVSIVMVTRTA